MAQPTRYNYVARQGQRKFEFPWPLNNENDIDVFLNNTLLTVTTDYTVNDFETVNTGFIVFTTTNVLNTGDSVTLALNLEIERLDAKQFEENSVLSSEKMNESLDYVKNLGVQTVNILDEKTLKYTGTANVEAADKVVDVLGEDQVWRMNAEASEIQAVDLATAGDTTLKTDLAKDTEVNQGAKLVGVRFNGEAHTINTILDQFPRHGTFHLKRLDAFLNFRIEGGTLQFGTVTHFFAGQDFTLAVNEKYFVVYDIQQQIVKLIVVSGISEPLPDASVGLWYLESDGSTLTIITDIRPSVYISSLGTTATADSLLGWTIRYFYDFNATPISKFYIGIDNTGAKVPDLDGGQVNLNTQRIGGLRIIFNNVTFESGFVALRMSFLNAAGQALSTGTAQELIAAVPRFGGGNAKMYKERENDQTTVDVIAGQSRNGASPKLVTDAYNGFIEFPSASVHIGETYAAAQYKSEWATTTNIDGGSAALNAASIYFSTIGAYADNPFVGLSFSADAGSGQINITSGQITVETLML